MPWSAPPFTGGVLWEDYPIEQTPINAIDLNTEESAEATYSATIGQSVVNYFEGGSSLFGDSTTIERTTRKDQAFGYPSLDSTNKIPLSKLPTEAALVSNTTVAANVLGAAYGGKADAVQTTASMVAGTNALSLQTGGFTAADVGKCVMASGIGPALLGGIPGPYFAWIGSVAGGVASLVTAPGGSSPANATFALTNGVITYGTGIPTAINAAVTAGVTDIYLPKGAYIWDQFITTGAIRLWGAGIGRTIVYFAYGIGTIEIYDATTGYQGASVPISTDVHMGDNSVQVAALPAGGLNPGDYIVLQSDDAYDSAAPFTKCGEFLRVGSVTGAGPYTIWPEDPVVSDVTVIAANNGRIQKVKFLEGVEISGIDWRSGTPEKLSNLSSNTTAAATLLANGGGSLPQVRWAARPKVKDCRFFQHSGPLSFFNCIHPKAYDDDFSHGSVAPNAATAFGYGVDFIGSKWGEANRCTSEGLHALINRSGAGASGDATLAAIPSMRCNAKGCIARSGFEVQFLSHSNAGFSNDIDCEVIGGSRNMPNANNFFGGFVAAGHYCKVIRPFTDGAVMSAVALAHSGSSVYYPILLNTRRGNSLAGGSYCYAINVQNPDAQIIRPHIDGVESAGTGGAGIYVQGNGAAEILNAIIKNTAGDAVDIASVAGTTTIDGLKGENIGGFLIHDENSLGNAQWRNAAGTSLGLGITNSAAGLILSTWWRPTRFLGPANLAAASAAGTYLGTPSAIQGLVGAAGSGITAFWFDPADYGDGSFVRRLRIRLSTLTGTNAPAADFTAALYPVASFGGGAGNPTVATIGAAVTGSQATISAPGANTQQHAESTLVNFGLLAAGWYVLGITTSAAIAASAPTTVSAQLQIAQS